MPTDRESWSLRAATTDDEEFLWTMLFYASHSDDEEGVEPADIRRNPDLGGYINGWKLAGHPGVIAESPQQALGAAWLRLLTEAERSNPVFVTTDTPEVAIAVIPGWEGRGIGSGMLRSLLARARGRFGSVVLSARADNPAIGLYERLGFRVVGEMVNRVGTISVKMIVDL